MWIGLVKGTFILVMYLWRARGAREPWAGAGDVKVASGREVISALLCYQRRGDR